MTLSFSELSSSSKVLPTPSATFTTGQTAKFESHAGPMKGGSSNKKRLSKRRNSKKNRKSRKKRYSRRR